MAEVPERLERQLAFLREIDRLKGVVRQTLLLDGSRRENSAEHSWHLAVMALVLAEYAAEPVDLGRVLAMLLVHDLVEVDAGDTFAYDPEAARDKAEREQTAARRLFGLLPPEQGDRLRGLWEEFESGRTPEARFAAALDRLQPLIHNYYTAGASWRRHGVTREQVLERTGAIASGSPALGAYARHLVDAAVAQGMLPEAGPGPAAHGPEVTT
jgi:putative hydrolase of HD superfamily